MNLWSIRGHGLPERRIRAETYDDALAIARMSDPGYNTGQVLEEEEEPDFIAGAPNYDKFSGWDAERVLAWLNID